MFNMIVFGEKTIKITSDAIGNIFFEGEDIVFYCDNLTNAECTVSDEKNEIVKFNVEYQDRLIVPKIPFGVYTLTVDAVSDDGSLISGSTEFSYVRKGYQAEDSIIGMSTHFSQGKGDMNMSKNLLKNAGVTYIRDDCSWDFVETEKGVYSVPEVVDNSVNNALEKGVKTVLVLAYGNLLYDGGAAPYTDAGRAAFAKYAKAVAEHFKGRVDTYEVWNEWDGGFGNPNGESAEVYAKLLKETYTALKSVDENIKVIAGATHTDGYTWFQELFEAEGFKYCDVISYHPYCYPQNPDTKDYKGNVEDNYTKNLNLLKEYGVSKEIWITEYGWHTSTAEGNVTERQQAEYLVRSYVTAKAYGVDKMFWYDFQNDGVDRTDRENEFGIIKCHNDVNVTYAAKPAYAALSAMTGILADAEFVKEYRPIPAARFYHFKRRNDNKDVVIAYNSINGPLALNLHGETGRMACYDMYGNICLNDSISDEPIYLVGENFNPQEIEMTVRNEAFAQLGLENYFNGIRGYYSGVTSAPDGQKTAWGVDEYAYFDIDDSYLYGYDGEIEMEITYYDGGTNNSFCVDYGNDVKSTGYIKTSNTTTWKKAKFNISDGNFVNGMNGYDFRIRLAEGEIIYISQITIKKTDRISNKYARAILSDKSIFDGVSVKTGDVPSELEIVQKNNRFAWKTDIDSGFMFLYLEDLALTENDSNIVITVDYFDEGYGKFTIECNTKDDFYTDTEIVALKNTHEWKTAVFDLSEINLTGSFFRIALWTDAMGMSSEDICFGEVNIINNDSLDDFNLNFDYNTKKIKISGVSDEKYLAVEILSAGKTESDLVDINVENVEGTIAYVNMIKPDDDGYFSLEFNQKEEKGTYIVRLNFPESGKKVTKLLNYFDCYKVENIRFFDKENNEVKELSGLNYVRVEADLTVYKNPVDGKIILACYDDNRLVSVDMQPTNVYQGGKKKIIAAVNMENKFCENRELKLFFMKDFKNLISEDNPVILDD